MGSWALLRANRLPWTRSLLTGNWPNPPKSHPESLNSDRAKCQSKMIREKKAARSSKWKITKPGGTHACFQGNELHGSFKALSCPRGCDEQVGHCTKASAEETSKEQKHSLPSAHRNQAPFPKPHQGPAEDSLAFCDWWCAEWGNLWPASSPPLQHL